jgi:hypothetical protein
MTTGIWEWITGVKEQPEEGQKSILVVVEGEKGGSGSGNYGHAGRPGMVGGSGGSGKMLKALKRADKFAGEQGKFSSGHVGRSNLDSMREAGYVQPHQGSDIYYELTDAGRDALRSAPKVTATPKVPAAPREYDWQDLVGQRRLSGVKAEALAKGLPGSEGLRVERGQSLGRNQRGQQVAATYQEGTMRLSTGVDARTVVHEVGHHVWDVKVTSPQARQAVLTAYKSLQGSGEMELYSKGYRPHSLRRSGHEFFADSYAMYFNGGDAGKANLRKVFPDVAAVMETVGRQGGA